MDIQIKGKTITLKYSLRAMMMYENITGGTLTPSSLTDVITFFYCVAVSSSMDYSLQMEDFIDWLDENPDVLNEFGGWL
jgi:hypothetical protein